MNSPTASANCLGSSCTANLLILKEVFKTGVHCCVVVVVKVVVEVVLHFTVTVHPFKKRKESIDICTTVAAAAGHIATQLVLLLGRAHQWSIGEVERVSDQVSLFSDGQMGKHLLANSRFRAPS